MDTYVESHLQWRALEAADLEALTDLRDQIHVFDDGILSAMEQLVGLDDASTLEGNAVGGWDDYGSLLAYGWNIPDPAEHTPRMFLVGGVHPAQRWIGIGASLLNWQEARAAEWAGEQGADTCWVGCFVEHTQVGLQHNLVRRGFVEERHFFDMYRSLEGIPTPTDVEGIDFVTYDERHSPDVRELHNLCFERHAGASRVDPDAWADSLGVETFRPEWSWLGLAEGRLVAYALSGIDQAAEADGQLAGWTDRLGVHPDYRGRHISVGLLQRTLGSMAQAGCALAGIGVDTPDPDSPESLHGLLEYEVRDAVVLMSKVITANQG